MVPFYLVPPRRVTGHLGLGPFVVALEEPLVLAQNRGARAVESACCCALEVPVGAGSLAVGPQTLHRTFRRYPDRAKLWS